MEFKIDGLIYKQEDKDFYQVYKRYAKDNYDFEIPEVWFSQFENGYQVIEELKRLSKQKR